MKKFKKIVFVLIALLIMMNAFTACKNNNNQSGKVFVPETFPEVVNPEEKISNKHEDNTIVVMDKNLITSGYTDYKIIISSTSTENTLFAAKELQKFLKDSSGAELKIVRDTNVIYEDLAKYISIGKNTFSDSAEMTFDYETLGMSGCTVKTKGLSVFIGGAYELGNINGVYAFLTKTINWETYTTLITTFDKMSTIPFMNYDILDIPDYKYRLVSSTGWSAGTNDVEYMRRMRNNDTDEMWVRPWKLSGYGHFHNTLFWLPLDTYSTEHPDWYADSLNQICYNAHGNATEYAAMQQTLLEYVVESIIKFPNCDNVNFTQMDNNAFCNCAACKADREKYGGDAGAQIQFCNDFAKLLNDYIKTNNDGIDRNRTFKIVFFAYGFSIDAPVTENADGTFSPIDDSVVCRNITPWFAPLSGTQYVDPLYHKENVTQLEYYKRWSGVSDKVDLWLYGANFQNYLAPYITDTTIADNFRYFANKGSNNLLLLQLQDNNMGTAFSRLSSYIAAKYAWNVNNNLQKITDNYFDNVFGPASDIMQGMYNEVQVYCRSMMEKGILSKALYASTRNNKNLWSKPVLDRWLEKINQAYREILPLKEKDKAYYDAIYEEIKIESIFVRFTLIDTFSGEYSERQLNDMKKSLINDIDEVGLTRSHDGYPIDTFIGGWRNQIY